MAFKRSTRQNLPSSYMKGQALSETEKSSKVETLQCWLCWTGSLREVLSSVSRGQRISSRCGAVKSVLCPKRLVTVERAPAIRVFLVWAATGFSRAFPPRPSSIPALRSSSLRLSGRPRASGEISPNPCSLAAATGDPGVPWGRQPPAAAVSTTVLEESVSGRDDSGPPGGRHFFSYSCVLAHLPLSLQGKGLARNL